MPTWSAVLTFSMGFLVGAITGAAGAYLADRFTDQRRRQEANRTSRRRFSEVQALMPALFDEFRADLESNRVTRRCVLMPTEGAVFNSFEPFFAYYEPRHDNLRGKFTILKNYGYVQEEFGSNTPIFILTEDFVGLLQR